MSLEFCPTLDELSRTGHARDAEGIERPAPGLSTLHNLRLLRSLMMTLKPRRTIEVGLAAGGSALTFAASHRDLGLAPARQHVAIDPYQRLWHHLGKTLIARAGLSGFVEVVEEPSCLALPAKMQAGETFQLAYIDGSHAYHEALLEFYYARHLLDIGGIVVFDDCAKADVRAALRTIRKRFVSVKEFDLSPFMPKPISHRVARATGHAQCIAFQKISDPEDDESWQWK